MTRTARFVPATPLRAAPNRLVVVGPGDYAVAPGPCPPTRPPAAPTERAHGPGTRRAYKRATVNVHERTQTRERILDATNRLDHLMSSNREEEPVVESRGEDR